MHAHGQQQKKPFYTNLTVQVLSAITVGILLGHFYPAIAVEMKPLGDVFIKMIKMVIGPIVFLTVVTGISSIGDMKKVGKVGGKAILYFEIVTTFALGLGLLVVNLLKPGAGMNIQAGTLKALAVSSAKRTAAAPRVPTLKEAGVDLDATVWFAIWAPAGTPRAVVDLLSRTGNEGLKSPEAQALLTAQGFDPIGGSPDDFARLQTEELAKWKAAVQAAGIGQ